MEKVARRLFDDLLDFFEVVWWLMARVETIDGFEFEDDQE